MSTDPVVVIGSGLGGLVAAATLARGGIETIVLEARGVVGGFTSPHVGDGYRFDVGATMLQTPKVLHEAFESFGERLEDHLSLKPLDPLYRAAFSDGAHLDLHPSIERTAQEVGRISSRDVAGFERYMVDMEQSKRALKRFFIDRVGRAPLDDWEFLGVLRRLRPTRSVADVMSRYFRHPTVAAAFSFQTLYWGASPDECPAPYAMVPYFEIAQGVWHVDGGINRVSDAVATIYRRLGGQIRCDARVASVLTRNGHVDGVQLEDGERIRASRVISNVEATRTYAMLGGVELRRADWVRLRRPSYSAAPRVVLAGVRAVDPFPGLPHHTFFMPSTTSGVSRILGTADAPTRASYLCVPSKTDGEMAPAGRTAMYALSLVPHGASAEQRTSYLGAASVLEDLAARNVGAVDVGDVEYEFEYRPVDFECVFNQPLGMGFGLRPILRQSGPFRIANRSRSVAGLYLAGASSRPGGGIPLVVASGRAAASALLRDLEKDGRERR